MDLILNECSLCGQFKGVNDFADNGIPQLSDVLKDIQKFSLVLLKKDDFWMSEVTSGMTFHDVVFGQCSKTNDRIRRLKSLLASLQNEPFWTESSLQMGADYHLKEDDKDFSGTGIAEAFERDDSLVSFCRSPFEYTPISVIRSIDEQQKDVNNIWEGGQLVDLLYEQGTLTFADYVSDKFCKRFDFSQIDSHNGLNLIESAHLEQQFISCLKNFTSKSWDMVVTDDGLDYKRFHENRNTRQFFNDKFWSIGIFKFRIDQEKRCFGYRKEDVFHVLRIDLDHKLSDLG